MLDPFCGCATTPIAAELEGRRWFGMDLWEGALKQVKDRLQKEVRLQNPDARIDYSVQLVEKVPEHPADNRKAAAPFLKTPKGKAKRERPEWQRMTKADMVRTLAEAQRSGAGVVVCAGCGVELAARYFELDHREPKGGGGEDWITNRVDGVHLRNKGLDGVIPHWLGGLTELVHLHFGARNYLTGPSG